MENNYQPKKEKTLDKNKFKNIKRKNEGHNANKQNKGYLNNHKNREQLALLNNRENIKNDSKQKKSISYDKMPRSQSEPNINRSIQNENISLEERIKKGFLEMNTNFKEIKSNIKEMKSNIKEMTSNLKQINKALDKTKDLLTKIHEDLINQNKDKDNNKSLIPSKINRSIKVSPDIQKNAIIIINNNNFIPLYYDAENKYINNNIKYSFPKDTIPINSINNDKRNFIGNPKDNKQHISLKEIEGFTRKYIKRDEPMDSLDNKNKYMRNINNFPNYRNNKNIDGPLDSYRVINSNKHFNISEPNNFNYAYPLINLSNKEKKGNSNKSSDEEFINAIFSNSHSFHNNYGQNNALNDNYSTRDSNQIVNNNYFYQININIK